MIKEKYTNKVQETTLNIVQTAVESVRKKDIVKTGLRLYDNGCIGVSGAIGKYDEKDLEQRARQALEMKIPYDFAVGKDHREHVDITPEIIADEEFVAEMEELLAEIREQQPAFSCFNKIRLVEQSVGLNNDSGLDLKFHDRQIAVELGIKEKKSANLFDAFSAYQGRAYDRQKVLEMTNEICNAFLNPVELPQGKKLPVVFNARDFLSLKQLMMDLHGQRFATGSSLLSGKQGQQVFSNDFTLYQSLHPDDCIQPFFDAEGVVNPEYRYTLIDQGKVVGPYTDKRTAAQFDLPLTGSAGAEYDSVPSLSYQNFKIKESEKTLKELLQGQMGIFVMIAAGGDFTSSGDFGTPVQLAFLFDGENLIGKLPELQLASSVYDMFGKDFVGVGKNLLSDLSNDKYMVMEMKVSK